MHWYPNNNSYSLGCNSKLMNETDVRIVIISGVTKHRTGTKYRSFPLINRGKTYIWVRCR